MPEIAVPLTPHAVPAAPATRSPTATRGRFHVADPGSPERGRLEAEIRAGFAAHFCADIGCFMPRLARYHHASGGTGVIGIRNAGDEPLFLERYLPAPVQAVIAGAVRRPVARSSVVEVGQFVVEASRIAPDLFRDLVSFLAADGYEWVCFTGTGRIRALVASAGLNGLCVGDACEQQAGDSGDRWGSYYDSSPAVIIGKLSDPAGHWCGAASSRAGAA